MLEGDSLVSGPFENVLQSWQFQSPALNAIFIAALATVLSYQTGATAYDILLGLKQRHITKASDFHAAILTDEGSPLSVWAAVLRTDWLDRARFPHKIPHDTRISREPRPVKKRVIAKLFVLLIVAPLFNLFAVVLTLERTQEITFAQAKFGGLALGVNDDLSHVKREDFTDECLTVPFKVDDRQTSEVLFFNCIGAVVNDTEGSWMSVETAPKEGIRINLAVSGILIEAVSYFSMVIDKERFRIRQRLTEEMLQRLLDHGDKTLSRFCVAEDASASEAIVRRDGKAGLAVSKNVSCTQIGHAGATMVISKMAQRVTLVDSNVLEIVRDSERGSGNETQYLRADDLILLAQRTSYVGLGTLFVITGCALLLRMIVKILTRNDVHHGIETILKSCFGAEAQDSLLRWNGTVRYDHKHQAADIAHFGVKTDALPEVKEFVGGCVGVADDRPFALVDKCIATKGSYKDVVQEEEDNNNEDGV